MVKQIHFRQGKIRTTHLLLVLGVFSLEALDATRRVDELLLAGEEGVTLGAYLQVDMRLRRSCVEGLPASARNHRFDVLWMDAFLHIFIHYM